MNTTTYTKEEFHKAITAVIMLYSVYYTHITNNL